MQRTTDWGRANVKIPTSSHCVKYRDTGMVPPERGSSICGWFARMVPMMFSHPPPAIRMPAASTTMPTSIAMPHSASVTATPRKPPTVVKMMTATPKMANPTKYEYPVTASNSFAPPTNCATIVAAKNSTMIKAAAFANALLRKRARITSITVTAPSLRDTSAIFLPMMP